MKPWQRSGEKLVLLQIKSSVFEKSVQLTQILGVIIANNPLDLACVDFTKVDPSKDGKENILVLTDAFTKFNQVFVTPNQKAITIAKILVDKWFYVYGIPAHIHSNKGCSFDNEIMSHLYAMYGVEQSTTMPYNPCGNAPMERLNHTLIGLLKSLSKEQKNNWPLHLPSLVFAYNAMPHDTTGYQPYELMFGHKTPTICDACLGLANYNDNFLQSKCPWVNQQHELILAANRWPLKRIKASAEKSVSWAGGKALEMLIGNLVLLCDHPEGHDMIQDNYKNELFVMESKHQDQMFISSNHLMVRVLCIWWTSGSYLTFISHRDVICHLMQPWYQTTYFTGQETH